MLKICDDDVKKTRAANTVFSGDRVRVGTVCDASVQTDVPPEPVIYRSSASVMCGECGVPESARCRARSGTDSHEEVQTIANVLLKKGVIKRVSMGRLPRYQKIWAKICANLPGV